MYNIWTQISFNTSEYLKKHKIFSLQKRGKRGWITNLKVILRTVCLGNIYIASGFVLILKAIVKNNDKLDNNELWLCTKTPPNKIVQYLAIFIVNMSTLISRRVELFTSKCVKYFSTPSTWHTCLKGCIHIISKESYLQTVTSCPNLIYILVRNYAFVTNHVKMSNELMLFTFTGMTDATLHYELSNAYLEIHCIYTLMVTAISLCCFLIALKSFR